MNEKERNDQGVNPGSPDPAYPPGGGNLENTRQRAASFFAAADAAIEGALSGDSAKFNQVARQEGGE